MNKSLYNNLFARLLYHHKLASGEQLKRCLKEVPPESDLGRMMVMQGLIPRETYQKIHHYILKMRDAPDFQQRVQEILGQAAKTGAGGPVKPPGGQGVPPKPAVAPTSQRAPDQAESKKAKRAISEKKRKRPATDNDGETLPINFRGKPGTGNAGQPTPSNLDNPQGLDEIFLFARNAQASDVHLSPYNPIMLRRFGKLTKVNQQALSPQKIQSLVEASLPAKQVEILRISGDLEMAHSIEGGGRYRVTLMEQRFGWEVTARIIPNAIRTFEASGLPASCEELTKWAQGLVLITGPLGVGKTSTLATLVEMVNQDRDDHIITMENPVEIVYEPARCQITQREIGTQTLSQGNALRAALRQDPDILVISELRDLDDITLAVSAAETGHLVFATMNTANATRTVNQLIDSFPPDEQDVVRTMISESLRGVISQQLVPRKDGRGMVAAYEVLIITGAVGNLIRKNNTHQLPSIMLTGKASGMVLLDESLKDLVAKDLIHGEDAFRRASTPKTFQQYAPKLED